MSPRRVPIWCGLIAILFVATAAGCRRKSGEGASGVSSAAIVSSTPWTPRLDAGFAALREARFDDAEKEFKEALRLVEPEARAYPEVVSQAHFALGNVYSEQRRLDLARREFEASLALDERRLGPDHVHVIENVEALAIVLDYAGDWPAAEERFRDVLARLEKIHGPDHPDVARALINLAVNLGYQKKEEETEVVYRRALAILEAERDPAKIDRARLADVYNGIGLVHYRRGKLAEARVELTRSLELREQVVGRDHPHVATPLYNLAGIDMDEGHWKDAEAKCGRAIAIREGSLPPEHPFLREALERQVEILRKLGRPKEAAAIEERLRRPAASPDAGPAAPR